MKITVNTKELMKALFVKNVIPNHAMVPVSKMFELVCNEDGLEITGCDGDIRLTSFIPKVHEGKEVIQIEKTGTILLPPLFNDIVKKLPGEFTTIEVVDYYVTNIQSKKATFTLHGMDAEEYPKLDFNDDMEPLVYTEMTLNNIFNQIAFAASDNSSNRPILTGINMALDSKELLIQATDSHRFARKNSPFGKPYKPFNIAIPKRTIKELTKIMGNGDKEIKVFITDHNISFKTDTFFLQSRLLEGNFPGTSQLIPTSHKTLVQVDKIQFLQSLERASVLEENGKSVVKFNFSPSSLLITSNHPEIGKVIEEMDQKDIKLFEGEELTVSFNGKYLKEALKNFKGDLISLKCNGAMKPVVLTDDFDTCYMQLLLPIRTY